MHVGLLQQCSPVTQYATQTQHSDGGCQGDGGRQGDGTPAVIIIIIIYSSRILITGL